ncbi:Glycosyltransferase involved in cell wall bisynthesis [Pricia antarctica]|uniref:Glycosyltransferase involved in cell wall bisynthesis n=1 Tax=Pricia antarctica TaxID=641691 RepID=A0A1G6X3J3_9FLAO|nr:glycosyltransferase family 4 protein [Pricia antarctica]SDD71855.1 Glycosyltransferase involved in cell wall bisynthesis [Pricia antarctica]
MKVLFQSRSNLYSAPGGDTTQIEKTKQYLEKLGVEVDISIELEPDLAGYDLVHLFNLMDPQELYMQIKHAKKHDKKVALSTIYGLYTEFERKARGGFAQKVANVLSPYTINYIKTFLRHLKDGRMNKGVYYMLFRGYYRLAKKVTEQVDVFLPNSLSEMKRVAREYQLKNYKFVVVPNAVDTHVFNPEKVDLENIDTEISKFKDCILSVARIEGRKSTLNLIKAVGNQYPLVLIGNETKNDKTFTDACHAIAGENVFFMGAIPHEKLPIFYKLAKVHALISWMETPGLSSLEAGVMETNIVITEKGDTRDYFEDYAFYCEPDDVASIRSAIDKAFDAPFNFRLKEKIQTEYVWEETAKKTLEGYKMI